MMEIRPTEIKDLPLVMEIYDYARAFMRATGNTPQDWEWPWDPGLKGMIPTHM